MPDPTPDPAFTLDDFKRFIHHARFRFAKTMPSVPHHYTVREWNKLHEFLAAVQFVRDHGYQATWGKRTFTYFDLDGHRYWSMGAPLDKTKILNRARIGDPGTPPREA